MHGVSSCGLLDRAVFRLLAHSFRCDAGRWLHGCSNVRYRDRVRHLKTVIGACALAPFTRQLVLRLGEHGYKHGLRGANYDSFLASRKMEGGLPFLPIVLIINPGVLRQFNLARVGRVYPEFLSTLIAC